MKKTLLLSAALLLGTYTSLFAQILATDVTVLTTLDPNNNNSDLGFLAMNNASAVGADDGWAQLKLEFTYNGTQELEFYVILMAKGGGTDNWIEEYGQPVVPSPDKQTMTFFFNPDGKKAGTTSDYPATVGFPLEITDTSVKPLPVSKYFYTIVSQPKGKGGAINWDANEFISRPAVYTIAAPLNPELSTSDYDFESGFGPYPNPVSSNLNVKLPAAGNVEIISLNGQVLMSKNVESVDSLNVSNLSAGVYVFRYTNGNVIKTSKLVKQ